MMLLIPESRSTTLEWLCAEISLDYQGEKSQIRFRIKQYDDNLINMTQWLKRIRWSNTRDHFTNEWINCVASLWIEGVINEEESRQLLLDGPNSKKHYATERNDHPCAISIDSVSVNQDLCHIADRIVQQTLLLLAITRSELLRLENPSSKMSVLKQVDLAWKRVRSGETGVTTNGTIENITQAWISETDPSVNAIPRLTDCLAEIQFAFASSDHNSLVEYLVPCIDAIALDLAAHACLSIQCTEPQKKGQVLHQIKGVLIQSCNGQSQRHV